jgi:hypothetical protein
MTATGLHGRGATLLIANVIALAQQAAIFGLKRRCGPAMRVLRTPSQAQESR